jgi:hypothetical protein
MEISWRLLFLVLALVLFGLAAFNVPSSKFNLGWAGMFCLTIALGFVRVST